jgi:hypothetical protein
MAAISQDPLLRERCSAKVHRIDADRKPAPKAETTAPDQKNGTCGTLHWTFTPSGQAEELEPASQAQACCPHHYPCPCTYRRIPWWGLYPYPWWIPVYPWIGPHYPAPIPYIGDPPYYGPTSISTTIPSPSNNGTVYVN